MADKKSLAFEEIKELFREVTDKFKDTDAKFKDTDAKFKDTDAKFKDTDAKFKDTDAKFKDTDAKFKDTDAKIDQLTDAVGTNNKDIGGLGKKWGDFSEAMIVGDALSLFKAEGMEVHSVQRNITSHYDDKRWEIDGIVVGKSVAIVIEAKATLRKDDVTKFIGGILTNFTKLEPDHEGKKIYGAMGFLNASAEVQAFAQKQGLRLIRPTHIYTELVPSPKDFKLRNFHP